MYANIRIELYDNNNDPIDEPLKRVTVTMGLFNDDNEEAPQVMEQIVQNVKDSLKGI